MNARISVRNQSGAHVADYLLRRDAVVTVGRGPRNGVVLGTKDDTSVSRCHAAIIPVAGDAFVLQDLGSRNGLLVNGEPARYRYLVNQDAIRIGSHLLTFESVADGETPSEPAPRGSADLSPLGTRTRLSSLVLPGREETDKLAADSRYASALYRIIRAVSVQSDFALSCRIAANELLLLLGFESAVAATVDRAGAVLALIATIPDGSVAAVPRPLVAEVVAGKNPVIVETDNGRACAVCIPINSQAQVEGVIVLAAGGEGRTLTDEDRLIVKVLSRDISAVLERQRLLRVVQNRNEQLLEQLGERRLIVGNAPALTRAMHDARTYGAADVSVIVRGETGTGKELIAYELHRHSSRQGAIFLDVNCAAIPESVLESELFGVVPEYPGFHSKEGLTGKIRLAAGGTLFLDEIGDMSPALQAKILRFLDEKVVWPLGAREPVTVDVRIIAATNRDLRARISDGGFREDLYQRLSVMEINLPALRERPEDVPVLAGFFLARMRERYGAIGRLAPASVDYLMQQAWPGNVRELRNAVERAVIRAVSTGASEIIPDHFSMSPVSNMPLSAGALPTLKEMERTHILRVLEHTNGNREQAYKILGISRASLFSRIKEFGLGER